MANETYVVFPQVASVAGVHSGQEALKLAGAAQGAIMGVMARLMARYRVDARIGVQVEAAVVASVASSDPRPQVGIVMLPMLGVLLVTGQEEVQEHLKQDPDVGAVVVSSTVVAKVPDVTSAEVPAVEAWHLTALGVEKAHQAGIDGQGVWIGVADSGIVDSHPEFAGRTVLFRAFDWAGKATQQTAFDHQGHGTHVAGIAVGSKVGVAPKAELAVASVLPWGSGVFAQILAGLDWLASVERPDGKRGVDIINLSMQVFTPLADGAQRGLSKPFEPILKRLNDLGIEVIAAAGNLGPGTLASPGNFASVLGVGALDKSGKVWDGSGCGLVPEAANIPKPDILAPGVDVNSASKAGGYTLDTGTSMATPAVSGLAALLRQQMGPDADLRAELEKRGAKMPVEALGRDVLVARY